VGGSGGEPVVTAARFSWVAVEAPWEHFFLFEAPEAGPGEWGQARRSAAHAFFASRTWASAIGPPAPGYCNSEARPR
jgi:hypothetical protein